MKTSTIFLFFVLGTISFNVDGRSRYAESDFDDSGAMFMEEEILENNRGYAVHRLNARTKFSPWQGINCWGYVQLGRLCPGQRITAAARQKVATNVAIGKQSTQSSSLKETFGAELALDHRKDPPLLDVIIESGNGNPWWQIVLKVPYAIQSVTLNNEYFNDVNIIVTNDEVSDVLLETLLNPGNESICVFNKTNEKADENGKNTFVCGTLPVGRFVNVQIVDNCKDGHGHCKQRKKLTDQSLERNEVEVVGTPWKCDEPVMSELKNVALHKPAKQSSQYGDFKAEDAVDGDYTNLQCSSTSDRFSWWRVDLEEAYMVWEVIVYNRENQNYLRFHDVTIRVSNEDISKIKLQTVFEPKDDSVCVEDFCKDGPIPSGKNVIKCVHPVVGRYVSLQIISDCKVGWGSEGAKCNVDGQVDQHILHVHEVEVMAMQWKHEWKHLRGSTIKLVDANSWKEFNEMLKEEEPASCSTTDIYASGQFPWWRIDLEKEYTVEKVIIVNRLEPLNALLHDIQIRVGNEDIGYGHNSNHIWDKNTLCAQSDGFLQEGKNEFSCKEKPKGKFVSIQISKKCMDKKCFMLGTNVLSLCDVEVIGEE